MNSVLVTGGSGFLGSHIADALTERGWRVRIFDLRPSPYLQEEQEFIQGDISDPLQVQAAVSGSDHVFHLAALADLNSALVRPLDTAKTNILGTINVLEAVRKEAVERLVFASTVYVYSQRGGFYRCSKQACEAYIEEYQHRYGLQYTILRYGSLYGPRADETNGIYKLLKQALDEGRISYSGRPDDVREYIHVSDAARLSVDALAPEYVNERLVLTGHHSMQLSQLFMMFSEILGRELEVDWSGDEPKQLTSHYRITPYSYNPKAGRKLTTNLYVDMGQGIIECLEAIEHERTKGKACESTG